MTKRNTMLPPVTRSRYERPTMRDVAEQAGVSLQTVSNYVNGRFHLMSSDTRERVGGELDRLGYWPNAAARSLRAKRSMTLGFLVLDEGARFLADPMTDLIIAGIGDVARDHGYSLLIQAARPNPNHLDGLFAPLLEDRVDGAFLFLSGSPSIRRKTIRRMVTLGFIFVVFEQAPAGVPVVSVTADNRRSARELAEHLLARGHRRIGFISTRAPWPMVEERIRGYHDALHAAGIDADPALQLSDGVWASADGSAMAERLFALPKPPTAIMCGNDLLALGAISAARGRGLRVPEDVAVTGFNDFEFAQFADPPLTTVAVPGYDLGRLGAESLIGQLGGAEPGVPASGRRLSLPVALQLRGSA
jgi:DNA-binding LacI/PurR family transcriptional regulator